MSFDIVIPLGPKELGRIHQQIEYTKQNVIGYRRIYIVTCNLEIQLPDCILIDENLFPFKTYIASYFAEHHGKSNRNGWYFQQLIKLYAGVLIPDILDNYLVIDADVFFLKPLSFMENNTFILTTGDEYHVPYFDHMKRMHSSFEKVYHKSGICHHMMFNKRYVNELFQLVEQTNHSPFWKMFITSVREHTNHPILAEESGASEYELYFNYMLSRHPETIKIRELHWKNIPARDFHYTLQHEQCDYVSVCAWMN